MARGEDNVGSHVNEGPSLTSSEDVPSHVDTTGVITWTRPVEEFWAYTFWKKFSFPLNVRFLFSSSRPHFPNCTKEDWGRMNLIY